MAKPHGQTRALKNYLPKAKEEDKLASARRQGQAQFDSIKEMVEALRKANEEEGNKEFSEDAIEDARRAIEEDALSVQVRSDWFEPCSGQKDRKAHEYEILLCTGGPACRIIGELNEHGEPETARLEVQDWFQPWTQIRPFVSGEPRDGRLDDTTVFDSEPILLEYARCFYFGEG